MESNIFNDILKEREYQNRKWGVSVDDKNTINDWTSFMVNYLGKAIAMANSKEEQRLYLIKVAALAVAALESFDRNNGFPNRHYDNF